MQWNRGPTGRFILRLALLGAFGAAAVEAAPPLESSSEPLAPLPIAAPRNEAVPVAVPAPTSEPIFGAGAEAGSTPVSTSLEPLPRLRYNGGSRDDQALKTPSAAPNDAGRGSAAPATTTTARSTLPEPMILSLPPGRELQPIDLANVLRLAGARDLDIALARARVNQALADLGKARALWLPSLFFGPTWYRGDGSIQTAEGEVRTINRNSLYIGGVASLANGYAAPSPGTGYPAVNGMSSVLRFSDAIYEPMAANRDAAARRATVTVELNNALLAASEGYFDLQFAAGRLAIAREAASNAQVLAEVTNAYAQSGQGKLADYHRVAAELNHQRKMIRLYVGQIQTASAALVNVLLIEPHMLLGPVEPAESIIRLIPDEVPFQSLLAQGLQGRPELAQHREQVNAAVIRLKQARLRPFIPSLGLGLSGGGFGGGANSFFGNFDVRSDVAVSFFWELQNLGFGDWAIMRRRAADRDVASLELSKMINQVAADVAAAYATRSASALQIEETRRTLEEAIESLRLNMLDMKQGANLPRATRAIEVLQPIQALVQARTDYLESVLDYNRSQFRLKRAIGQQP